MRLVSFFLVALACLPDLGLTAESGPTKKFELGACKPPLPKDARCGVYEVFENREAKSGRKIPLQVVVLPATGPERVNDPLVYFAGGPGASSIEEGVWIGVDMPEILKRRDILLVDGRGTGMSEGLVCEELRGVESIQGFLDEYMDPKGVRTCLERFRKTADLTQYSNNNVVDDVEEIRIALGYGQVNVMGSSYGTRPAQVYLRRHPKSVRTMVLDGVLPLDEPFPVATARYAQQALDGLLAECEGDPACKAAFPKLREETAAVFRQVEKEPARVRPIDDETGRPIDLVLTRNGVAQVLRRMLYYPPWIALTPISIHRAANGDWQLLGEFARVIGMAQAGWTEGYFLSITCSEDLAYVREVEVPAAVAGTFLGDFRLRKQQQACAGWPAPKLGPDFPVAVTSDVPALLLSGGADPVTPPSSGAKVARTLKRSRQVVIPDAGHSVNGMRGWECPSQMISEFVAEGTPEALDTSCVARMKRPDFVVSLEPEVELKPEELERLTGTWSPEEGSEIIKTEVVGGLLRVTTPEEKFLLAATSPTRFRPRSGGPSVITFGLRDGRAVSMTIEKPDKTLVWTREQ